MVLEHQTYLFHNLNIITLLIKGTLFYFRYSLIHRARHTSRRTICL